MHNIETLSFSRGVFFPGEYFFRRVMVMCHWICSTFLCENASRKKSALSKKLFLGTKNKDINHPLGSSRQQGLILKRLGPTKSRQQDTLFWPESSPQAHPSSATLQCTVHAHNTGGFQCWQRSLCSKRFQLSQCAKVRAGAKKTKRKGKGEGKGGNAVSFSPLPLPCHSFSLLSSQLSRQTCAETLATQAICSGVGCVGYVNFI